MSRTLCEQVLSRIICYLELVGVPVTRETCLVALRLAEEALAQDRQEPMAYALEELPKRFTLPGLSLPPAFPPIERGSIGYGDRT